MLTERKAGRALRRLSSGDPESPLTGLERGLMKRRREINSNLTCRWRLLCRPSCRPSWFEQIAAACHAPQLC